MRNIPLTQGKVAIVNDGDYSVLSQFKWFAQYNDGNWYAMRNTQKDGKIRLVSMHRQILGDPQNMQIDHADGDGLNNIRSNLRICTNAQNSMNRRKLISRSGFKGVRWCCTAGKYRAQIVLNSRHIHLGYFTDKLKAAKAYDIAARRLFGKFAFTNF